MRWFLEIMHLFIMVGVVFKSLFIHTFASVQVAGRPRGGMGGVARWQGLKDSGFKDFLGFGSWALTSARELCNIHMEYVVKSSCLTSQWFGRLA